MRSVGGGFDNESVALTCMSLTFYLWVRALRPDPSVKDGRATRDSVVFGVAAALAYICMAAAWGGYVFVVNLVGIHATWLVLSGSYSSKLHRAYSLFYFLGTLGAIQVPVINLTPLKSLEQIGPLLVFIGFQFLEFCEIRRRRDHLSTVQLLLLRMKAATVAAVLLGAIAAALVPTGYFGPLSARVRGLFVKHTRTGNPLVDSVAEHQPASDQAYQQYLHETIYSLAPMGFALVALRYVFLELGVMGVASGTSMRNGQGDRLSFLLVYGVVAYYFSSRMARLVVLLGPVASALAATAIGTALELTTVGALQEELNPGSTLRWMVPPEEAGDKDIKKSDGDGEKGDEEEEDKSSSVNKGKGKGGKGKGRKGLRQRKGGEKGSDVEAKLRDSRKKKKKQRGGKSAQSHQIRTKFYKMLGAIRSALISQTGLGVRMIIGGILIIRVRVPFLWTPKRKKSFRLLLLLLFL